MTVWGAEGKPYPDGRAKSSWVVKDTGDFAEFTVGSREYIGNVPGSGDGSEMSSQKASMQLAGTKSLGRKAVRVMSFLRC